MAVAAGCDAGADKASAAPVTSSTDVQLLEAGGIGQGVTSEFSTKARNIRVDYRFTTMPPAGRVNLSLERKVIDGGYETVINSSADVPESLSGSKSLPINPGTYRLRIDASTSWSAKIFEPKS